MIQYKEINVNPKNRKTGDCSTRALVGVLGISYAEALKLQFEESLQCYYDPTSKQVMERVLAKFGYIKMAQPKKYDGTKYEVREIDQLVSKEQMKILNTKEDTKTLAELPDQTNQNNIIDEKNIKIEVNLVQIELMV